MKRIITILLFVISVSLLVSALAEDNSIIAQGKTGNATYRITRTQDNSLLYKLSITGSGKMGDYDTYSAPWSPYRDRIKEIEISDGITYIGLWNFYGIDLVETIIIPNSVTKIRSNAFSNCRSLKTVVLPEKLTLIDFSMFRDCISLSSVEIPETVETIGIDAFCNCSSLNNVVFPSHLKEIGSSAFYGCKNLRNISIIPDSVTQIGALAFSDCAFETVEIPEKVSMFDYSVFQNCKNLKTIIIPSNVTKLKGTFLGCESLEKVIMEYGLISIGENTFRRCYSLKTVYLPESVIKIEKNAFLQNDKLMFLYIPDSVTNIEEEAIQSEVIICCHSNTYAEEWAAGNNHMYIIIEGEITQETLENMLVNSHSVSYRITKNTYGQKEMSTDSMKISIRKNTTIKLIMEFNGWYFAETEDGKRCFIEKENIQGVNVPVGPSTGHASSSTIIAQIEVNDLYLRNSNGTVIASTKKGDNIEILGYDVSSGMFIAEFGGHTGFIKGTGLNISKNELLEYFK